MSFEQIIFFMIFLMNISHIFSNDFIPMEDSLFAREENALKRYFGFGLSYGLGSNPYYDQQWMDQLGLSFRWGIFTRKVTGVYSFFGDIGINYTQSFGKAYTVQIIDYLSVSHNLEGRLKRGTILNEAKHSDHCPVLLEIE